MLQKLNFVTDLIEDHVTTHITSNGLYQMSVPDHKFWSGFDMSGPVCVFSVYELEPGIYQGGLNFNHDISAHTDYTVIRSCASRLSKITGLPVEFKNDDKFSDYYDTTINVYGVADSIDQIKAKYKEVIDSPALIVISVTEMNRSEQSESDGWRWHKWGEYIGTQDPQMEYLYDEPVIEQVFVFHVYSVIKK